MSASIDPKEDLYAIDLTAAVWEKSPLSTDNNDCVEITRLPGGGVAIRDSKNPDRPHLCFTATEWAAHTEGVKRGLVT